MANNLYSWRKHLGPLDHAQINAAKAKENLHKTVLLNEILKDIEDIENQLATDNISSPKIMMLKAREEQLNKQLYDFLGVPYDNSRTTKDN